MGIRGRSSPLLRRGAGSDHADPRIAGRGAIRGSRRDSRPGRHPRAGALRARNRRARHRQPVWRDGRQPRNDDRRPGGTGADVGPLHLRARRGIPGARSRRARRARARRHLSPERHLCLVRSVRRVDRRNRPDSGRQPGDPPRADDDP